MQRRRRFLDPFAVIRVDQIRQMATCELVCLPSRYPRHARRHVVQQQFLVDGHDHVIGVLDQGPKPALTVTDLLLGPLELDETGQDGAVD